MGLQFQEILASYGIQAVIATVENADIETIHRVIASM